MEEEDGVHDDDLRHSTDGVHYHGGVGRRRPTLLSVSAPQLGLPLTSSRDDMGTDLRRSTSGGLIVRLGASPRHSDPVIAHSLNVLETGNSPHAMMQSTTVRLPRPYYSVWEPAFRSKDPGIMFWPIVAIVPALVCVLLFAVIPLKPPSSVFSDFWIWSLIVMPLACMVISYCHSIAFLFCMNVDRPFRGQVPALVMVWLVTSIACVIISLSGPEVFLAGLWLFTLTIVTTLITIRVTEGGSLPETFRVRFHEGFRAFVRMEIVLYVMVGVFVLYVVAWRKFGSTAQRFLPIMSALVVFIFRKVMLSITDMFHIEVAMIASGFWVQSLEDMLKVMAFPSVKAPSSFLVIWVVPFVTNLANLLFLTDNWFRFRIWVKQFCKRLFCCGRHGSPCDVHEVPILTDVPDERGHSNNKPGYHRRQVRFFIWKLVSQMFAMVFWLAIGSTLRFGLNNDDYPFSRGFLTHTRWRYSMIFAGGNLVVLVLTLVLGVTYVRHRHPIVYRQIKSTHSRLLLEHRYVALLVCLALANGFVAIFAMQLHCQVWYAVPPRPTAAPTPAPMELRW